MIFSTLLLLTNFEMLFEDIMQQFTDFSTVTFEEVELYEENLGGFYQNKIQLNSEEIHKLENIFFLSKSDYQSILRYKKYNRGFFSKYELKLVKELSATKRNFLYEFVEAAEPSSEDKANFSAFAKAPQQKFISGYSYAYPPAKAIAEGKYLGEAYSHYISYNLKNSEHYEVHLNLQKDIGEPQFRTNHSTLYDFRGFSARLSLPQETGSLIVGDYKLRLGMGLVSNQNFRNGKGSNSLLPMHSQYRLSNSRSMSEILFMRGLAYQWQHQKWHLIAHFSQRSLDANLDSLNRIRSLPVSGLHRSVNELQTKNQTSRMDKGLSVRYHTPQHQIGANLLYTEYEHEKIPTHPFRALTEFTHPRIFNASLSYDLFLPKLSWSTELAMGKNKRYALSVVSAASFKLTPNFSANVTLRRYPAHYIAAHANPFAESNYNNENGIFFALDFQLIERIRLFASADFYNFPAPKFGIPLPSSGREGLLYLDFTPNSRHSFYLQYRQEIKEQYVNTSTLPQVIDNTRRTIRLHAKSQLNENLFLSNRLELSQSELLQRSNGVLFFSDLKYFTQNWKATFRYTFYKTNFAARIYSFLPALKYQNMTSAYVGEGSQFILLIENKLTKRLAVALRLLNTLPIGKLLSPENTDNQDRLLFQTGLLSLQLSLLL